MLTNWLRCLAGDLGSDRNRLIPAVMELYEPSAPLPLLLLRLKVLASSASIFLRSASLSGGSTPSLTAARVSAATTDAPDASSSPTPLASAARTSAWRWNLRRTVAVPDVLQSGDSKVRSRLAPSASALTKADSMNDAIGRETMARGSVESSNSRLSRISTWRMSARDLSCTPCHDRHDWCTMFAVRSSTRPSGSLTSRASSTHGAPKLTATATVGASLLPPLMFSGLSTQSQPSQVSIRSRSRDTERMPMPFFAMRGVRKYVAGEVGPHVNVAGSRQSFKTCGMRYARGVLRNW
mmetsp:Transcript_12799/g.54203  ORF Transcript_12799/g.54203 Transcript_12799/m.54203 type:complete len:295 (-) Transcript_12799:183-1067(-)